MNRKHRGSIEFFDVVIIISLLVAVCLVLNPGGKKEIAETHKLIDATPITVINGQQVHVYKDHIYYVVIGTDNKPHTIY